MLKFFFHRAATCTFSLIPKGVRSTDELFIHFLLSLPYTDTQWYTCTCREAQRELVEKRVGGRCSLVANFQWLLVSEDPAIGLTQCYAILRLRPKYTTNPYIRLRTSKRSQKIARCIRWKEIIKEKGSRERIATRWKILKIDEKSRNIMEWNMIRERNEFCRPNTIPKVMIHVWNFLFR